MSLSSRARHLRFYNNGAHPSDRFCAAPCGCVFLFRRYEERRGNNCVSAEPFWQCSPCAGSPCTLEVLTMYSVMATTYLYGSWAQDQEGTRWQ